MTALADSHAVITGAGGGIGAAIAHTLYGAGARLTLVGRHKDALRDTARNLPGTAIAPADVTDRVQVEAAIGAARDAHGPIDILVNNAGIAPGGAFADVEVEEWDVVMDTNCHALFHFCQTALTDLLAASHGRIVTIASTAGLKGYAYTAPYVASKHAAVGLMRALAVEFAKTNLTANAVCPGFTDTRLANDATRRVVEKTGRSPEEAAAALKRFNPQGRLVEPQEVARAVLWLCLPESRSLTGLALPVCGGEI